MIDIPIKTEPTEFPVENAQTEAAAPDADQDTAPEAPVTNGAAPPMAVEADGAIETIETAEAAVAEQAEELAGRFIMDLPEEDFKSLKIQRTLIADAGVTAREAQEESFKRQVIANMLQGAYNATWQALQKKHGLPESLDMDWATGSTYRKQDPANTKEGP